jgi:hypothetical protein
MNILFFVAVLMVSSCMVLCCHAFVIHITYSTCTLLLSFLYVFSCGLFLCGHSGCVPRTLYVCVKVKVKVTL